MFQTELFVSFSLSVPYLLEEQEDNTQRKGGLTVVVVIMN